MFTGLIEQLGEVKANVVENSAGRLILHTPWDALQVGESIAVNGVCLTLQSIQDKRSLVFDVSSHTLELTNLGSLRAGDTVNLERATIASARLGGHYVSGHVDATAFLLEKTVTGDYMEIVVGDFSACASMYLLPKGSITLDGVSLTINAVHNQRIQLMLVPHTLAQTTLKRLEVGQRLNVEFDYLARIVAHQLKQWSLNTNFQVTTYPPRYLTNENTGDQQFVQCSKITGAHRQALGRRHFRRSRIKNLSVEFEKNEVEA